MVADDFFVFVQDTAVFETDKFSQGRTVWGRIFMRRNNSFGTKIGNYSR
jgi:hypothetical protein